MHSDKVDDGPEGRGGEENDEGQPQAVLENRYTMALDAEGGAGACDNEDDAAGVMSARDDDEEKGD